MTDATAPPVSASATKGRSLWADAWARLKGNKAAMVSGATLAHGFYACHICIDATVVTRKSLASSWYDSTAISGSSCSMKRRT